MALHGNKATCDLEEVNWGWLGTSKRGLVFCIKPVHKKDDLRLSGPLSSQGADGGARARDLTLSGPLPRQDAPDASSNLLLERSLQISGRFRYPLCHRRPSQTRRQTQPEHYRCDY
ncbi:hypothetical protein PoB_003075800 [Plakobranchus ocellatus]|uniref:Uncharacterized protein n=1 Tax=Plakobranchus ocellatus TaxID=259542 RepID=A0AAV4AAL2_9GAST|nr:hypothetical protein PoB_003075800 [Plakobranchus ocellatus]